MLCNGGNFTIHISKGGFAWHACHLCSSALKEQSVGLSLPAGNVNLGPRQACHICQQKLIKQSSFLCSHGDTHRYALAVCNAASKTVHRLLYSNLAISTQQQ